MNTTACDAAAVRAALSRLGADPARFVLDLRAECASTNSELLALAEQGAASRYVLLAERQSAGRGRRQREWIAAPGDSLTLSLLWRFAPGTAPAALSLAVGVAIAEALRKVGAGETALAESIGLKWPNDVLLAGRKLAGVLVELVPGAPHAAVIGIGLNRRLPAALPDEVRALAAAWPLPTPAEELLAALLVELDAVCSTFTEAGFAPLQGRWQALHAYQDQPVTVDDEFTGRRPGICRGVAADGALLLESAAGVERVLVGDVSLRPA